jgi:hypothetical protein
VLHREILRKQEDFTLLHYRRQQKRMKIEIGRGNLPTGDGRLLVCHGQRDMCAVARIDSHPSERRGLRDWNVVILATICCDVVVMIQPTCGTIRRLAGMAVGHFVVAVAASA